MKGNHSPPGTSTLQSSLKMAYVGMTRPTQMLCVAAHKDGANCTTASTAAFAGFAPGNGCSDVMSLFSASLTNDSLLHRMVRHSMSIRSRLTPPGFLRTTKRVPLRATRFINGHRSGPLPTPCRFSTPATRRWPCSLPSRSGPVLSSPLHGRMQFPHPAVRAPTCGPDWHGQPRPPSHSPGTAA